MTLLSSSPHGASAATFVLFLVFVLSSYTVACAAPSVHPDGLVGLKAQTTTTTRKEKVGRGACRWVFVLLSFLAVAILIVFVPREHEETNPTRTKLTGSRSRTTTTRTYQRRRRHHQHLDIQKPSCNDIFAVVATTYTTINHAILFSFFEPLTTNCDDDDEYEHSQHAVCLLRRTNPVTRQGEARLRPRLSLPRSISPSSHI